MKAKGQQPRDWPRPAGSSQSSKQKELATTLSASTPASYCLDCFMRGCPCVDLQAVTFLVLGRCPPTSPRPRCHRPVQRPSSLLLLLAGGTMPLREHKSPLRTWVWVTYGFNAVVAVIFTTLCAFTYKAGLASGLWHGRVGMAYLHVWRLTAVHAPV